MSRKSWFIFRRSLRPWAEIFVVRQAHHSERSRGTQDSARRVMRSSILFLSACIGLSLFSCALQENNLREVSRSYSQYIKGLLNDRLGSVDEAVRFYKEAQKLDQGAPELHLQLGFDYIRLKKFDKAAGEFEKAVRLSPDDDNARYVLALVYVGLNDFKKAADQYENILKRNLKDKSHNIVLRRILSQLYFLEQDYPAAQNHCNEILRLDPLDEWGLYLLAVIAGEKGQTEKAAAGFKEVLAYYPDNSQAMNALAYLYAEADTELDKALVLSRKALEYAPDNGAYLDTLGWVYFKIGELEKAVSFLEQASKLTIDPEILNHLAQAYYKKGMLQKAKDCWTSSLKLDPKQTDIKAKLKTL